MASRTDYLGETRQLSNHIPTSLGCHGCDEEKGEEASCAPVLTSSPPASAPAEQRLHLECYSGPWSLEIRQLLHANSLPSGILTLTLLKSSILSYLLAPKTPRRLSFLYANRHTRISVPCKKPASGPPVPFSSLPLFTARSPQCLSWADKAPWRWFFSLPYYSLKNSPVELLSLLSSKRRRREKHSTLSREIRAVSPS